MGLQLMIVTFIYIYIYIYIYISGLEPDRNIMALLIKLVSVALLGLVQGIYYKGVGLVGFQQLQSGDRSVLPSGN